MRTETSEVHQFDSRHEVLAQLQKAGLNTTICDALSIESLNELMCGVKQILKSSQPETTNQDSRKAGMAALSVNDKKIISKLMLSSGKVSSVALSRELGIPFTTLQRRKKKLEEKLIETRYSIRIEELGWKRATLFVSVSNRELAKVGSDILALNKSVINVNRIIGSMNVDLAAEVIFKTSEDIVNMVERIKLLSGVKQVEWIESLGASIGTNKQYYEEVLT